MGWASGVVTLLEYVASPEALKPDRLVFVDWAPAGLTEENFPSRIVLQQARDAALAMEEDRAKATEALVRGMFKAQPPGPLAKEMTDGSLRTPLGTAIALLFDLATGDRRPAFLHVDVPTLIVTAEENRLIGEFLQSKISRSQLQVIPDAGHALFLERPQAFNQAIEDFLGKQ